MDTKKLPRIRINFRPRKDIEGDARLDLWRALDDLNAALAKIHTQYPRDTVILEVNSVGQFVLFRQKNRNFHEVQTDYENGV